MQREDQRQREVAELATRSYMYYDRMWLIVIIYSPGFAWNFLQILISSCTSRTWCHMNLIWASFCPRTSGPEMCTVGMSSMKMFEGVVLLLLLLLILLLSCAPPLHQRTAKKTNDHLPSYSASEDTRVRYIGQRSVGHICPLISWWGQCISAKAGRGGTAEDDGRRRLCTIFLEPCHAPPDNAKLRTSETIKTISKRSCILLHVLHHGHVRPCFLNLFAYVIIRAWCSIWQRQVLLSNFSFKNYAGTSNDGNVGGRLLLEVDQAVSLKSSAQTFYSWWVFCAPIGFRGEQ